ncbi:hypothetical protein HCG46_15235 [Labrenzia sp. PO1]|uniref:hypothetical protein n=1 Tax=Labrenzia sp. PO1 TaxID=2720390 RepID=UPI001447DD0C|nr:hypothetical protein [Labrenzia sp. PO1]NKI59626.1 hypothetical protein [Labrenzia sp. PO1]
MGEVIERGKAGEAKNRAKLKTYLNALKEAGEKLPQRDGGPNITAIARATKIGRNAFYGSLKQDLNNAVMEIGLEPRTALGNHQSDAAGFAEKVDRLLRKKQQEIDQLKSALAQERRLVAKLIREQNQPHEAREAMRPHGLRVSLAKRRELEARKK